LSNCYRFKLKSNSINANQAHITSFMKLASSVSVELKSKKGICREAKCMFLLNVSSWSLTPNTNRRGFKRHLFKECLCVVTCRCHVCGCERVTHGVFPVRLHAAHSVSFVWFACASTPNLALKDICHQRSLLFCHAPSRAQGERAARGLPFISARVLQIGPDTNSICAGPRMTCSGKNVGEAVEEISQPSVRQHSCVFGCSR